MSLCLEAKPSGADLASIVVEWLKFRALEDPSKGKLEKKIFSKSIL